MNRTNALLVTALLSGLAAGCKTDHSIGATVPAPERDAGGSGGSPVAPGRDGAMAEAPVQPPGNGAADTGGVPPADAATSPGDTAAVPGCPPGQATPAEVAATPRADENLELMALWMTKKLVAPQATYDRLVRDVAGIKQKAPEFAKWEFNEPFLGRTLLVQVTADALQKMRTDTYQPWACANKLYGFLKDKSNLSGFGGYITLEFKGRYHEDLLAEEYGRMPGFMSAQRNGLAGIGGPSQTICATPEGDTWHYLFAAPLGPAGVNGSYTHFAVDAAGTISALGSHQGPKAFTPNPPPLPDWVAKYMTPTACVVTGQ